MPQFPPLHHGVLVVTSGERLLLGNQGKPLLQETGYQPLKAEGLGKPRPHRHLSVHHLLSNKAFSDKVLSDLEWRLLSYQTPACHAHRWLLPPLHSSFAKGRVEDVAHVIYYLPRL